MMRLLLSYFDQNEEFAKVLPQTGSVERVIRSRQGAEWAMVRLDEPIEYRNCIYHHVLLRSRWHGSPIGGDQPTSVHVVLVTDDASVRDGFVIDPKDHVAWGMVEKLRNIDPPP